MGNIQEALMDGGRDAEGPRSIKVATRAQMDHYRSRIPLTQINRSTDTKELQDFLTFINSELESLDYRSNGDRLLISSLRRRKELINSRLWEISNEKQINSLRDAVKNIPNPEDRGRIQAELDALEASSKSFATENQEGITEQYEWEKNSALLKQHISERKWNVRSQLLARESVATLVGSLLLVGLATVITIAVFTKIQVSEILANSFLIVLGYFFGQNSDRRKNGPES